MSLLWILVVVLLIVAIFGAPTWPHARGWGLGWYPSGGLILVVLILVILLASGRMGTL
jgi:peptidoglycan/LPS O-acetylase OafA/YrhL